jgi:acetolactate synthase I/II/III large subunit
MARKTVAQAIIDRLVAEGSRYIFVGPPTSHELGFVNALFDRQDEITPVLVRHEAMAPLMAEGWFRATGHPGAFHVGAGPALANTVLGVMSAYTCGSAVIGISGQAHTRYWGWNAMQEVQGKTYAEGHRILDPIVKRYWQLADPENVTAVVNQAYSVALSGRPGPVLIDVPMNFWEEECDFEDAETGRHRATGKPAGDPAAVEQAFKQVFEAETPVLLCGNGVIAGKAADMAVELAERFSMPVVTTFNAKSAIPFDHPLAMGCAGAFGSESVIEVMREADLVVALGTRFDEWTTSSWVPGLPFDFSETRLIQVDIVADEIGRHYPVTVGIQADVKHVLDAWLERAKDQSPSTGTNEERVARLREVRDKDRANQARMDDSDDVPVRPERVLSELRGLLARDAIVIPDAGANASLCDNMWQAYEAGTYIRDTGSHAMGYAPAAALGVKLGQPDRDVVVVTGDGCMTQVNFVLATAAEYGIAVKFVVLNNSALGSIVAGQENAFGGRVLCSAFLDHQSGEPYEQDFSMLARSYQVEASRVTEPGDLQSALKAMLEHDGPCLVDVVTEPRVAIPGPGGLWVTDKSAEYWAERATGPGVAA